MLELKNVSKSFGRRQVLRDVDLRVAPGRTHALVGTSGSGKTTLLRITLGLTPLDSGWVRINGQALSSFSSSEWSEKIGYVPQDGGLFPHLTAFENATLVARLRGRSKASVAPRVDELAGLVDLDPRMLRAFPHAMSGGQRQRVSIMRAAFLDPQVMILDEPMGALDPLVRFSLQGELKNIFSRLRKTVLIVTHDFSEAAYLARSITILHEGRVVQTGTYRELAEMPSDPFISQFIAAHRSLPDFDEESPG